MGCNTLKKVANEINHMTTVETDPAEAAGLNIKDYTDASLKFLGTFEFDAPPKDIWPMITEGSNIAKWFPIIYAGKHARGTAKTEESCEVGSKRMCKTIGMGTLDETFLYFDRLKVSAYSLKNPIMPVKDHAAVMHLEEFEPGKTRMTWAHYFNYRGLLQRHFFPFMMTMFMNMGIKKLARTVGGKGGRVRAV